MFKLKFGELVASTMYKFVEGEWPTWMKVRGDCANVVIDPNEPFKI